MEWGAGKFGHGSRGLGVAPGQSFISSFCQVPWSQVWLLQVTYPFPEVCFKSPIYKCQIWCWSFQFLLDPVVLTFLNLRGRGITTLSSSWSAALWFMGAGPALAPGDLQGRRERTGAVCATCVSGPCAPCGLCHWGWTWLCAQGPLCTPE